ncbi:MAG TPA: DNA alkylation repair protein [Tepidisphaeraceae bacterium]|nr:DNA alkylation repair protein [Tepidisphaeraceae bacterium]
MKRTPGIGGQGGGHPAERFAAPGSILAGSPLKGLMGAALVGLVAESFAAVRAGFDVARFRRRALKGLDALELTGRAAHIAAALAAELPAGFEEAGPILIAALGPELAKTGQNGLAPFFYLPHSQYIAARGGGSFESGMRACYELTKRFTAEFCIRPFAVAHEARALALLAEWAGDPNPHVRRLVSEGTRPRLPWAARLPRVQADPSLTLGLLERLRDDDELYVRRSVANHLADIAKDHPTIAIATCERWLDEVRGADDDRASRRRWVVRHALRLPAKKGDRHALRLCKLAGGKR